MRASLSLSVYVICVVFLAAFENYHWFGCTFCCLITCPWFTFPTVLLSQPVGLSFFSFFFLLNYCPDCCGQVQTWSIHTVVLGCLDLHLPWCMYQGLCSSLYHHIWQSQHCFIANHLIVLLLLPHAFQCVCVWFQNIFPSTCINQSPIF